MIRLICMLIFVVLLNLCSSSKTKAPQAGNNKDKAIAKAGKSNSGCDPNYSGCVPIASDVDCAGGGGNGPEYVKGPVTVIGKDVYGLDRDGDGIGCE